ncbi:MAG: hydrogenase maturation protease [Phycisphaerales bacterium]|nr:hydrogenase maturation protease [Phycisphaerales bacterium]
MMTAKHDNKVCIIGCGRWLRRDDQVGLFVAQRLEHDAVDAEIVFTEAPGTEIAHHLENCRLLIAIDAAEPDERHPPGTWQRIDYREESHRIRLRSRTTTHTMSIDIALKMSQALDVLPETVWVYAVAIANADYGEALTPDVGRAVSDVSEAIRLDVARWTMKHELSHA